MPKVEIYSADYCPYCVKVKNILKSRGVEFTEIDITGNEELRDEIEKRTGGQRTVPQIFVDGKYKGDDDDLEAIKNEGRWEEWFGK